MEGKQQDSAQVREWLQQALSLTLTVAALLLYATILGGAIYKTFAEDAPAFNDAAVRAAGLLSGFVGAVVTAGFARGDLPASAPGNLVQPMTQRAARAWNWVKTTAYKPTKFLGLADLLGLGFALGPDERTVEPEPQPEEPVPASPQAAPIALWISVLYFIVYFLVGIGAFLVIIIRPVVSELIANSAWAWLGTLLSSGYSYFRLGAQR